jgi:hypothetical protein
MNAKTIDLYIDLWPGWQDRSNVADAIFINTRPADVLSEGMRRVRVTVELPCFGGSAEVTDVVRGTVKEEV